MYVISILYQFVLQIHYRVSGATRNLQWDCITNHPPRHHDICISRG